MQSLNFNEGYKEFSINGDETRVIRLNPTDLNILERFEEAQEGLQNFLTEQKEVGVDRGLMKVAIREALEHIFSNDYYDVIFGKQDPCTPLNGKLLFENVIEGLGNLIKPYIKEEEKKMRLRSQKYVKEARANATR